MVLLMIYYVEFDLNEENFDKKLNMLWSLSFLLWKETMGQLIKKQIFQVRKYRSRKGFLQYALAGMSQASL